MRRPPLPRTRREIVQESRTLRAAAACPHKLNSATESLVAPLLPLAIVFLDPSNGAILDTFCVRLPV